MRALLALAIAPLAIACGPAKVSIDPYSVSRVDVRPASGQGLFCPGDPFQVEILVKMKNGMVCSTTDRSLGCQGKSDAVVDPEIVRLEVTPAMPEGGHDYTFVPDPNPLTTAATGLNLHGWIEVAGARSVDGENTLKPVYTCLSEMVFVDDGPLGYGQPGRPGPELHVAVTPLSTPWYANGALVRVDAPALGITRYAISPSADKPITIVSRGQNGAPGQPGVPGQNGKTGSSNSSECGEGGRGGDGSPGGPGGPGGDGGPGGVIQVVLDADAADRMAPRVKVMNPAGLAGPGGPGGPGGQGGQGGSGGPSGKSCTGRTGPAGATGAHGAPGPSGAEGPPGPVPAFATAPRPTIFASELPAITKIEATPRAR